MSLLVTGSGGFVGRYLKEAVPCVGLGEGDSHIDLRDEAALRRRVAEVEAERVIHLAAQSFIPRAFEDPRETFEINFLGTWNLLTALADSGFRGRFLYVSSGDVYGRVAESALPVDESQPTRPANPYAVSKVAAEALCCQWSQTADFEVIIARPFNHIGPGQDERFFTQTVARQIAAQAATGHVRLKTGNLAVTRDFLDVRDVVRAYLALLERGDNGEIYNVCSGREIPLNTIVEKLVALAGVDCEIVQEADRLRPNEQRRMLGSPEKLIKTTAWSPECELDTSLAEILEYWREKI